MGTKVIESPEERIKTLMLLNPKTKLNTNIAARKYYQSGQEWISMGDVYAKENNLEQAYTIYYTKFMTLFLQIIKKHPDYKNVSIEEHNLNYRALREVFPKIENIKTKLLEQYRTQYELNQEQITIRSQIHNLINLKQLSDNTLLLNMPIQLFIKIQKNVINDINL